MKFLVTLIISTLLGVGVYKHSEPKIIFEAEDDYVTDVLLALGENYDDIMPNFNIANVSVQAGETLVKDGFAQKENGGKGKRQSKHFVCTSCHNLQIEDPDLTVSSPEARLSYVSEKGLPFLQGTTLYGAINRTSFYNGDYYKKYGELVETARHDIRNAIQLCATECAQGRALEPWEMESIMAYFWDIGFRMSDLDLNEKERERIKNASSDEEKLYARELIKSKYLSGSPATFVPPPADRNVGTGLSGNYESGKKIYELSCLHCHLQERYSFFDLEKNNMSVDFLRNKMATYSSYSIYQVIRWGVPSYSGRTSYMPQYPLEKLSDQQLADLREFLEKGY